MTTYSDETLHLDSDSEEVEFNSGNGIRTDRDTTDIELNSGNGVHTDRDTEGVEFNNDTVMESQQEEDNSNGFKCISEVTNDDVRDMEFRKTKGAPKKKFKKKRCCSHCRKPGHTIRKCPILAGIDVTIEDEEEEEEEASPVESDNDSESLNVSISQDVNDDMHSVELSNPGKNVDSSIGIKRKRDTKNGYASATPNITINIENNGMVNDFKNDSVTVNLESQSARWNHGLGHGGNYFTMYNGIPNHGGSVFPPTSIVPSYSYSNTAMPLNTGTHSVPGYPSFTSVLKEIERLAKHCDHKQ